MVRVRAFKTYCDNNNNNNNNNNNKNNIKSRQKRCDHLKHIVTKQQ